ncbi:hypothetical protein C8Q74DRAFT_18690 [Fomes fomentarius]|nr:hypothetical protein C8Q74DRAFT_18690 [Fomes fomentarius]
MTLRFKDSRVLLNGLEPQGTPPLSPKDSIELHRNPSRAFSSTPWPNSTRPVSTPRTLSVLRAWRGRATSLDCQDGIHARTEADRCSPWETYRWDLHKSLNYDTIRRGYTHDATDVTTPTRYGKLDPRSLVMSVQSCEAM